MGNATSNNRTHREGDVGSSHHRYHNNISNNNNINNSISPSPSFSSSSNTAQVIRNKLESRTFPLSIIVDQAVQTEKTYSYQSSITNSFNIKRLFIGAFVAYIAVIFYFCMSTFPQSVVVYLNILRFPFGDLSSPQRFGLSFARSVNFTTEDGILLQGYHVLPPTALVNNTKSISKWDVDDFDNAIAWSRNIIVYFHGNGGTRATRFRVEKIKQMVSLFNAHVITFDYRGFGDSAGWPSEHGTLLDSRAVSKWLHNVVTKYNPNVEGYCPMKKSLFSNLLGQRKLNSSNSTSTTPHLIFYGHSLGSAIATAMATEMNHLLPGSVSGLILDSPIESMTNALFAHPAGLIFSIFPVLKNMMMRSFRFKHSTIEKISSVGAPILLIHGNNDIQVSPTCSKHLKDTALSSQTYHDFNATIGWNSRCVLKNGKNVIQLVQVPNAGHNNVFESPIWFESTTKFVDALNTINC